MEADKSAPRHVRAFICAPYPPSARAFRSRSAASECAGQVDVLRPLSSAVALPATQLGPAPWRVSCQQWSPAAASF